MCFHCIWPPQAIDEIQGFLGTPADSQLAIARRILSVVFEHNRKVEVRPIHSDLIHVERVIVEYLPRGISPQDAVGQRRTGRRVPHLPTVAGRVSLERAGSQHWRRVAIVARAGFPDKYAGRILER